MSAPNLSPEALAAARVKLAAELADAIADHAKLVERDRLAEENAGQIGTAAETVKTRRDFVARQIDRALGLEPDTADSAIEDPADGRPPLVQLVETINEIDAVLATAERDKRRSSSELGNARAERERAAELVATLRVRLRKLVEP